MWLQNIKHTRVCIRKCHFRWIIYERAFKYSSRLLRPEKIFKLGRTPQNISFKWRNTKLERKLKKRRRKVKNERLQWTARKTAQTFVKLISEWTARVPQVCFSVSFFSLGLHFYDQTQYPERRKDWSMFFFGIFLVSFYFWFCSTILHGGFCYQEMFAQK